MRRHHTAQINCAFVKVRRRKVGITMRMAAKRADITTKHWSNVENGRARPSIGVVIRMAGVLKCRSDELLTDSADMSIKYLEQRLQETIQAHESPGKLKKVEPLEIKEFLIIAKMLGYLKRNRVKVGYDAMQESNADETLLNQFQQFYESALLSPYPDHGFIDFLNNNLHVLNNILTTQQQDALDIYFKERVIPTLAIPMENPDG